MRVRNRGPAGLPACETSQSCHPSGEITRARQSDAPDGVEAWLAKLVLVRRVDLVPWTASANGCALDTILRTDDDRHAAICGTPSARPLAPRCNGFLNAVLPHYSAPLARRIRDCTRWAPSSDSGMDPEGVLADNVRTTAALSKRIRSLHG